MPKSQTQLERNTFIKGLITEASPLNFPENASIDEQNFILNIDGSRQRRLGLDYEVDNVVKTKAGIDYHKSSTIWENAGDDADKDLGVYQIDKTLYFYERTAEPLSEQYIGEVTLIFAASVTAPFSYASINGELHVLSKDSTGISIIKLIEGIPTFSTFSFLTVRDLQGVDDGFRVDYRPTSAENTDQHMYNLYNQGWTTEYIDDFFTAEGVYPSNADIASIGVKDDGTFDSSLITASLLGKSNAPRGKYTLNPLGDERNTVRRLQADNDGFTGTLPTDDKDNGAVDEIAPYANRIFYTGAVSDVQEGDIRSPNYTGSLFFSALLKSEEDYGRCYQEADPTSSEISDLLSTDGGVVRIAEAGKVLKLTQLRESLMVLSTNGVWEVSGPDGVFRTDDFSIKKLTSFGPMSSSSVVAFDDKILFFAKEGIILVYFDSDIRSLAVKNITEGTIQSYYDDVPDKWKRTAVGGYDLSTKTVRWAHNLEDDADAKSFTCELIFNTVLGAFYKNTLSLDQIGLFTGSSLTILDYLNTDLFSGKNKLKFLVINEHNFETCVSFVEFRRDDFTDFGILDAKAYLLTGWESFGESQRKKQLPYLTTHFVRTETGFIDDGSGGLEAENPSSCLISTQWDFADHVNSGKWTRQWQAYRLRRNYIPTGVEDNFDYGWQVVTTKNRVRGSGKTISFLIESEPKKNLHMLGWAMNPTGGTTV